mmetsp:Transcript_32912/g.99125  ORF Transcript_32912/g.99125 Transcript_32912/m.99125 type:complete len:92 (-) Transcript_32912:144-419(-)
MFTRPPSAADPLIEGGWTTKQPIADECPACFQTLCCEHIECCKPICSCLDYMCCCCWCKACASCLMWVRGVRKPWPTHRYERHDPHYQYGF